MLVLAVRAVKAPAVGKGANSSVGGSTMYKLCQQLHLGDCTKQLVIRCQLIGGALLQQIQRPELCEDSQNFCLNQAAT